MRKTWIIVAVTLLFFAASQASATTPIHYRNSAIAGADALLGVQFDDGAFPWVIGQPGKFQNVQGITAMGLVETFKLTGDLDYLGNDTSGALGNRAWLVDYIATTNASFISSSNLFFMGEMAVLRGDAGDLALAREWLDRDYVSAGNAGFSADAAGLAEYILTVRANQGHTNMGIWDLALFIRAAQDVGRSADADAMAAVLANQVASQDIVDPLDATANWYELGLSGLLFGLSEAQFANYQVILDEAAERLALAQCGNGSFTSTWQGEKYCDETQSTAFAVIGLNHALKYPLAARDGCTYLRSSQDAFTSGWDVGGYEIAEINAETVIALTTCAAPANNGVTSYVDTVRDRL